jgi:hypothetical protein
VTVLTRDSLISAVAPAPAKLEIPATTALVQANVTPAVDEVAVYPRGVLLQIFAVAALVITAVGLTVTVRVNGVPLHPFMPGVMIYIAFTGAVVVLVRDSLISAVAPAPATFDIPATTALVHVNDAPAVELVAVYPNGVVLQTVCAAALVMTDVGLTVTTRLNGVPAHPPKLGVIIYVTATGAVTVLIKDSLISAVAPAPAKLEIPATTALVQANVAPAVDDVAVYPRGVLLQTFAVAALVITAVGLTVTVRLKGVPLHPLILGVITYIALTGAVVVFVSDSLIRAVAPAPARFEIPATTALVHENDAPAVELVAV